MELSSTKFKQFLTFSQGKVFLIFREMELLAPSFKTSYIFSKRKSNFIAPKLKKVLIFF